MAHRRGMHTSYAGAAFGGRRQLVTTWYSSPPAGDPSWIDGFIGRTDIRAATIDLTRLRAARRPAPISVAR